MSNRRKKNSKRTGNKNYRASVAERNDKESTPQSMEVWLPWTDVTLTYDPGAVPFGLRRWRMNSPFDPDPLLGGESAYLFSNWALMYRKYRTVEFRIDALVVNNEDFPVVVNAAPSDADIVTSVVGAPSALDVGEMNCAVPAKMLSAKGGMDKCTIRKTIKLPWYVGDRGHYMADDQYAAIVNTNPAYILYFNLSIAAAQNFVDGIGMHVKCYFKTLFTDLNFDVPHALSLRERVRIPQDDYHSDDDFIIVKGKYYKVSDERPRASEMVQVTAAPPGKK